MKTFFIPVYWTLSSIVVIEADNLEEALRQAKEVPLPPDGEYVDGSFEAVPPTIDDEP